MCVWEILMDRFLSQLNDRIFKTQGKAPQTAAKRNCEPEDKTMLHRRILKSLESQKTGLKLFFSICPLSFTRKGPPALPSNPADLTLATADLADIASSSLFSTHAWQEERGASPSGWEFATSEWNILRSKVSQTMPNMPNKETSK